MMSSLACSTTLSLYHAHKGFVLCTQKIRTGPGVVLLRDFGADTSQRSCLSPFFFETDVNTLSFEGCVV
jgi:hypothetical protein